MTPSKAYLAEVRRGLAGMDRRVRDDILRELRAHLADAVADGGEANALERLELPNLLAARYKALYGYGRPWQAAFIAIATLLAVPTLPILLLTGTGTNLAFSATLVSLLILVGYLMAVAVKAGARVGLMAGGAACASRFVSLAVFGATAGAIVPDLGGWAMFSAVSLLLLAIGYLPGRAREKWRGREISL